MMKSLSFILAVLSVNFILTNGEELKTELRNQTSDEFEKILKNVEAVMDPTVDPCGNFYQFVCGNFSTKTRLPYNLAYEEIERRVIEKYEQEEPLESENKLSLIKNSRNLYKSCIKTQNDEGFKDFVLRHIETFGGWPALKGNSWNKSAFNWKRTVLKVSKHNEWRNYLSIQKLPKNHRLDIEFDPIVYDDKTALEFAARFGGNNSVVKEELEKVNEFSKNFLKNYSSYDNAHRKLMIFTIQNLTDKYPDTPWLEHFRNVEPDIQLTDAIIIPNSDYIDNLYSLLNNADQRMLANIVAQNRVANLDKYFARYKADDCFQMTLEIFEEAPNFLYLNEFAHDNKTKEAKQFAETISNKIRRQFIEMLRKADWIDNKTTAIEKLEKLYYEFGYSQNLSIENQMNKFHDQFQTNQTNFYDVLLSMIGINRHLPLDKKLELTEFAKEYNLEAKNIMNAKYLEKSNSIVVKLALLQRQFLDINQPMWMNFAVFGSIIAHEIARTLDPNLIQSNPDGKSTSQPKDSNEFIFAGQKLANIKDDGRDNLGLEAAYQAYKNLSVKEKSRTLHKKEYSPDQLFWIYATNRVCAPDRSWYPNRDKCTILSALSNINAFSRDFNCPAYSPMNRQQKCRIF